MHSTSSREVVYHLGPTSNHNWIPSTLERALVVYHLVPTSNHNARSRHQDRRGVVYHLVPTSNHNSRFCFSMRSSVVYHLVPTSNHNEADTHAGGRPVVYHLVPTSNHNLALVERRLLALFIILFLHQTTTMVCPILLISSCLSSCSYIKPQPLLLVVSLNLVVYHLVPTSNHNRPFLLVLFAVVVYHLVPTSNHNRKDDD